LQPSLNVRGGLERVVLEIARRYDPIIYTYRYVPENTFKEFREFDIRVIKTQGWAHVPVRVAGILPERVKWGVQSGAQYYTLKIRDDYDVINAHGTPSEWARNNNPRMLWYCHTPNREAFDLYEWRMRRRGPLGKAIFWSLIQFYKWFEFDVVPKIEKIVTNSANSQVRIKKYLHRDAEIIPPGINVSEYHNSDYEKFFFYPSRITPEKRFELAIEAFRMSGLHDKGFRLVIAGSLIGERKEHVEYYNKICEMIKGIGEVRINIPYPELIDLYSRCYAVLFTPINEDFGIVPLEAMASQKPVIAINEGGPAETVVHKRSGFLANNIEEIAFYMNSLAEDIGSAERMGRVGREHVKMNFGWDNFFRKFDMALSDVASSKDR